jgi:predicted Zn-dependent protease|tara:strand:+ start:19 stop:867 length:849 start_codon:yes stop_codon:yes gene_type:complete
VKNSYNINRRKFLELFGCSCCGFITSSCGTTPITERKQLIIYPESVINRQAAKAYENLKNSKKIKLITKGDDLDDIVNIGEKIAKSVSIFFKNKQTVDPTENFDWEYILIDNKKMKNAWCMPGGKIAVYTGILDVAKNKHGLATIMGHEIAHAVAKHSVERMSQAMAVNVTLQISDIFTGGKISQTRNTIGRATGMDVLQLGIMNPFGRKQETEADYLGLIFASLSGYNIKESVSLWERMKEANKGKEPPQFLSTHPSSTNRIQNLKNWVNKIMIEYPPIIT